MARSRSNRVLLSYRVAPEAAALIKQWLADNAGKPLYAKPGVFAESALLREIERQNLIIAGVLPPDGGHALQGRKASINTTRKNAKTPLDTPSCSTRDHPP